MGQSVASQRLKLPRQPAGSVLSWKALKTIEFSEASDRLKEVFEAVARSGEEIVVTVERRPLVSICPPPQDASGAQTLSVWDARAQFEHRNGPIDEELPLPDRKVDDTWHSFLEQDYTRD
jgi:antitoxin (DNA-binding transcriptional repressor) of toxin-antitoxin stability system